MKKNKLGITDFFKLEELENKIVQMKLNQLDYLYSFNQDSYNFEYIEKLHNYLFEDIYYPEDIKVRSNYSSRDIQVLDKALAYFYGRLTLEEVTPCQFSDFFYQLWDLQLFPDGNTRTVYGLMKVTIEAYQLPFELAKKPEDIVENYGSIGEKLAVLVKKR